MVSKYDLVETGWTLQEFSPIERPPAVVPAPRLVICTPRLLTGLDGSVSYTLDVSWQFPLRDDGSKETFVTSYFVEFRRGDSGLWGNRQETSLLSARYENVGGGTFYARVAAVVAANSKVSAWTESGSAGLTTVQAIADFSSVGNSAWAMDW